MVWWCLTVLPRLVLSVFIVFLQVTGLHSPYSWLMFHRSYGSLCKVFSILTWLPQTALICLYLAQFLNITSLGITFLVYSYFAFWGWNISLHVFFLILRITDIRSCYWVFQPLYVTWQFSHTTFSIVSLYFWHLDYDISWKVLFWSCLFLVYMKKIIHFFLIFPVWWSIGF